MLELPLFLAASTKLSSKRLWNGQTVTQNHGGADRTCCVITLFQEGIWIDLPNTEHFALILRPPAVNRCGRKSDSSTKDSGLKPESSFPPLLARVVKTKTGLQHASTTCLWKRAVSACGARATPAVGDSSATHRALGDCRGVKALLVYTAFSISYC